MTRRISFVMLLSVLLVAIAASPALAATWYVDGGTGSDLNDGTTPATAFKSVTRGMAEAVAGDTVSVMENLYAAQTTAEVFPIDLKSGVTLQGSGPDGTTIMGDGVVAALRATSVDAAAVVDGFRITGGHPGIECSYAALTISNNTITGNTGDYAGAGIHTDNGAVVIVGNVITDNHATYGGGICSEEYDSSTILGNVISGNTAAGGGGVCAYYHADPSIVGNDISGNSANLGGGVLSEAASLPFLDGNTFSGNSATGPGGGLMGYSASALIDNCVFTGNTAGTDGGAIALMNSGASEIVNCTIVENTSGAGTAGIARYSDSWPASALITNCIVWHNDNVGTGGWDDVDAVFEPTYSDLSDRPADELLHNLNADPLFVDPGVGDFHLGDGSPCVDAGDDAVAPATDFDGVVRPQGDACDLGAFERVAPEPDTTPPTITVVRPQEGVDYVSRDGTTFEFSATDDESGVASLVATLDTGEEVDSGDELPLKPDTYILTIVATDGVGNVATVDIEFTVIGRGPGGGSKPGPGGGM